MSRIPKPYNRVHVFGSASSNNPGNPIQGTQLDPEFNAIEVALDETQARLAELQNDDGTLQNGIVTIESLSQDTVDFIEETAAGAALDATAPVLAEMYVIKTDTAGFRDEAAGFANNAAASAAASLASANASASSANDSQISADDSSAEATDAANSADLARYYYDQLNGALDALAPQTITFVTAGSTATYELPISVSDEEFIDVHVDGLLLDPSKYSVTGTTLTFTPAITTGKTVVVKIAASTQIMPIVVDDWGFIYESVASAEDWGSIV